MTSDQRGQTVNRQDVLTTERLLPRPFRIDDAGDVQRLVGDADVASTTLSVPHPYEDGMAEEWIVSLADQVKQGTNVVYAVVSRDTEELVGAISQKHRIGEFGYWVGKPYWEKGYCTEAAGALLTFCFSSL